MQPTFSSLPPGVRPAEDGADLDEAEALVGALQELGKTPTGAVSHLLMALAVILDDTHDDPDEARAKIAYLPDLLHNCFDSVRRSRAEAGEAG